MHINPFQHRVTIGFALHADRVLDSMSILAMATRARPFSIITVTTLKAYHSQGMKGVGEKYKATIAAAAAETGLTEDQVKVCCI